MKINNKIIRLKRFINSIVIVSEARQSRRAACLKARKSVSLLLVMILSLFLVAVPMAGIAEATDYYVDLAGTNDGSHGTSTGAEAFKTIQYAINDSRVVAGDAIFVAAGEYDEQVVINKSLTLQGAGDTTIIKPSQTTANSFQTWPDGFGHTTAGIITADTTGLSVTVKNLKVDGDFITSNPTTYLVGVFYLETGGTIDSVTVEDIDATGTNVGIYISVITETVSVEVKDSTCTNFQKNGMTARGSTLTVSIHDNTITGWGPTDVVAQNGIQVSDGATGTISGNVVSDHYYTGTDWAACAILIFEAGSLTISDNTLTDNLHGVYLSYRTSGSGDGVTIDVSGGTITGAYTGIYLYGDYGDGTVGGDPTLNVNGVTVDGASMNGVYIKGNVDFTLLDNTIKNTCVYGIYISQDQCPVVIDGNMFQSNAEYGIMSYGVSTATPNILTIINNDITGSAKGIASYLSTTTAHYNNISGNTWGVYNWDATVLNATKNWWGDDSGPHNATSNPDGTGNAVSDNVDYDPWYIDEAMTTLSNKTDINSYKFEAANNADLTSDVISTINSTNHTVSLTVPYGTDVTALVATFDLSAGATAKVGETAQVSGTTPNDFSSSVTYTITSLDETTTQNWTVTVTLAAASSVATLSNLTLSEGTLSPTFDPATTNYTAAVTNNITSITVTPTVADTNATIKVNDITVVSGSESDAIDLTVGENTITIIVTAQDETTKTYTVTVTRAASSVATLSGLTVDGTTISGFSPSTLIYNKVLPYGTTKVPTVAATPTDSNNATKEITQAANVTGTEAQRTAMVLVTAEDGITTKTYKVIFGSIKVTITKTGPTTANQGANITYTITYKNEGTFNATNVVITETYPSEVEYVLATLAPDSGTNNKWTIPTLAPGEEDAITVTVHIK